MLKLKSESELRNRGQALDTRNPNQAVPLSRLRESQEDAKEEGPTKAEPPSTGQRRACNASAGRRQRVGQAF